MNKKYTISDNPHKKNKGIYRVFRAILNSWNGLIYAYKEESAFRQELVLAVMLIPTAIYLPITNIEKVILIGSVLLVLIIELLNSSIEAAIDRISFDIHDLSKRAKDFGSAAVMIALILMIMSWVLICYPLL